MLHSLRWKLLVGFILIVLLAVGTVTFIATRTTTKEFDKYISQDQALRYQRLALLLSGYYEDTGSWKGVQKLIEKVEKTYPSRILLTNLQGRVMWDSKEKLKGETLKKNWGMKIATLSSGKNTVGYLYLESRARAPIEKAFLASVDRSVLLGAGVAGVAGILLTVFYSRRILTPIKALTRASEKIRGGELDQKVKVNGSDEIGKLAKTFNAMARKLKEQERLRRNMVNDIAHELRNPLSKSHAYLEALKEGAMKPSQKIIETLYRNSLLLKRLIDDLHDLAMVEAGKIELDPRPVVLQDIVTEAFSSLRPRMEEKEIQFKNKLCDPILVEVDPGRIEQVLRNLFDNAVAHTPEGGVISIQAKKRTKEVEVSVADTGEGIPPEDLPYLFNRFYRVDKSRSRSTGGSGLGLTIAKEIIEAHHGEIWVESEEGEGTVFTFTLPGEGN